MEKWIDKAVALMHRNRITQSDVAEKYGCQREYINRILNGKEKTPKGAKKKILTAIDEIIANK